MEREYDQNQNQDSKQEKDQNSNQVLSEFPLVQAELEASERKFDSAGEAMDLPEHELSKIQVSKIMQALRKTNFNLYLAQGAEEQKWEDVRLAIEKLDDAFLGDPSKDHKVYFELATGKLSEEQKAQLQEVALVGHPNVYVLVGPQKQMFGLSHRKVLLS